MRDGIRRGGRVQGALVVVRAAQTPPRIVVYLRVSWTLGYHVLRRWRGKGDRIFRTTDGALQTVWRHGYHGSVAVYRAGDPALARFQGVVPEDQGGRDSRQPALTGDEPDEAAVGPNRKRTRQGRQS